MKRTVLVVALAALLAGPVAAQQVTSAQVQQAIDRGVRYLKRVQRADGSWPFRGYNQGGTALAAYALLLAGIPPSDPALDKALDYIATQPLQQTYSVALAALALSEADSQAYLPKIKECARWLLEAQLDGGMWTYGQAARRGNGDNSNTQFGVLGLWAAERAGVEIDEAVWRKISAHFQKTQDPRDGSWGYTGQVGEDATYSMTAAALGCLLIANHELVRAAEACGEVLVDKGMAAGLNWLERTGRGQAPRELYQLYALERVGMFSNQSVVAGVDWYRSGASWLVSEQRGDGSWFYQSMEVGTSFALLFLAKGRAPLVVSKLRVDPEEESRIDEVEKLVRFASVLFDRKMTWQSVGWETPLERTLLAPILFINHHEPLELDDAKIELLRKYVASGGTIVGNACCKDFDLSFRKTMARAFPSRDLEALGDDHPIYSSEYAIRGRENHFLEGIHWNCRLSVIYSPRDLTYGWSTGQAKDGLGGDLALQLGANVLRYLVDRGQNLDRLKQVVVREGAGDIEGGEREAVPTGAFIPAVVVHGGDWDPDPPVGFLLLESIRKDMPVRTSSDWRPITLDSKDLFNHPFLILKGHEAFSFPQAEIVRLRTHLQAGGFLYVECCCGQKAFDEAARALARVVFPDRDLAPIGADHELWRAWEEPLEPIEFTPLAGREKALPPLEGVEVDGRLAFVYSPIAIGCAIADHERTQCAGVRDKAAAIAIYERLVAYALAR